MQHGEDCIWYLLNVNDQRFGIQYVGVNPRAVFPPDISGIVLVSIR